MDKDIERCLKAMASMHLVCIGNPVTHNEKISRYVLELYGFIDIMRDELGGEFRKSTPESTKLNLKKYYEESLSIL